MADSTNEAAAVEAADSIMHKALCRIALGDEPAQIIADDAIAAARKAAHAAALAGEAVVPNTDGWVAWAVVGKKGGKVLNVFDGTPAEMEVASAYWPTHGFVVRRLDFTHPTSAPDVAALRAKAFQDGWDTCWERWSDMTRTVSVSAMNEDLKEYLAQQETAHAKA